MQVVILGSSGFVGAKLASVLEPSFSVCGVDNRPGPRTHIQTEYQGELACAHMCPTKQSLILRLNFPYGPGQERGLIPTLIKNTIACKPVTLNTSDGRPRISPLYIDDCCSAILEAIKRKLYGIYNCGGNDDVSILDLTYIIGEELGIEPRFSKDGSACEDLIVDSKRLWTALDRTPSVGIRNGIRKTVRAFRSAAGRNALD